MSRDTFNTAELEALVDRLSRDLDNARAALELRRNPSAPSHITKSQAARMLEIPPARITSLVAGKVILTEKHFGTEMLPMWSVLQYQSKRDLVRGKK